MEPRYFVTPVDAKGQWFASDTHANYDDAIANAKQLVTEPWVQTVYVWLPDPKNPWLPDTSVDYVARFDKEVA